MLKAGFLGCLNKTELHTFFGQKEFEVTGHYAVNHENICQDGSVTGIPVISRPELLNECDVLIVGHTYTDITDLLKEAIKNSMPVMFLHPAILNSGLISDLIKIQEESQTVVYINKAGQSKSLLKACRNLITNPSLFELRHLMYKPGNVSWTEHNSDALFRVLDALLFLCPLNYQKIQTFRLPRNISNTCLISARIEFDNGSVANIISTDITENECFTIIIHQKCRLLKINLLKNQFRHIYKTGHENEINSKTTEFNSTYEEEFSNELRNFHKVVSQNNFSGDELFNVSRVSNLSKKILTRAGFS